MTEIRGIYTLWLREVKRYVRDRARIVSSFVQPLLWLVIFGSALSALVRISIPGLTYQQYIFPGIIGQTLLFTSMFIGISVIWDREFGFLKEIMVAPISRFSVFAGKLLGASTDAMIQGIFVFVLGALLGITSNPLILGEALPVMILITFGLVSIGLTVASFMQSLESFGLIVNFINMPMFFLSGAIFLIRGPGVPSWLQIVASLNPFTYAVDALRTVILGGSWQPLYPLYVELLVVTCFDLAMIAIGTWAFGRRK
ncbi:MAG: ABC transporter permease [Candidatus Bathyarchaeia archaeon]